MTRTKHPVVLIHGVFGYGRRRPFWNRWLGYWSERALDNMDAHYLLVDVGALSSDHDRACEAFFQLYGGRVDYGEEHSRHFGHSRFGETFEQPQHPNWSEENPVHLLGHSVGTTTAIELYQLICQDYFGVGSNHKWVKSIVSIAGPLSGTTLTHFFGLHDAKLEGFTLGHFIGASMCMWHRLSSHFPVPALHRFDRDQWQHNDGAVNICSMAFPQQLPVATIAGSDSDASSDASAAWSQSSAPHARTPPTRFLKLNRFGFLTLQTQRKLMKTFEPGVWHVHKVASNHKAGANFDRESPRLLRQLLRLVANEFEN